MYVLCVTGEVPILLHVHQFKIIIEAHVERLTLFCMNMLFTNKQAHSMPHAAPIAINTFLVLSK